MFSGKLVVDIEVDEGGKLIRPHVSEMAELVQVPLVAQVVVVALVAYPASHEIVH